MLLLMGLGSSTGHEAERRRAARPWLDASLPPRGRAVKLLAAMTRQDKLLLLHGGARRKALLCLAVAAAASAPSPPPHPTQDTYLRRCCLGTMLCACRPCPRLPPRQPHRRQDGPGGGQRPSKHAARDTSTAARGRAAGGGGLADGRDRLPVGTDRGRIVGRGPDETVWQRDGRGAAVCTPRRRRQCHARALLALASRQGWPLKVPVVFGVASRHRPAVTHMPRPAPPLNLALWRGPRLCPRHAGCGPRRPAPQPASPYGSHHQTKPTHVGQTWAQLMVWSGVLALCSPRRAKGMNVQLGPGINLARVHTHTRAHTYALSSPLPATPSFPSAQQRSRHQLPAPLRHRRGGNHVAGPHKRPRLTTAHGRLCFAAQVPTGGRNFEFFGEDPLVISAPTGVCKEVL